MRIVTQKIPKADIHQRIAALINHFSGGNKTAFGRETNILPGVLASITGGRLSKPSFELLEKIKARFPSVSGDWLITGDGSMLLKEVNNKDKVPTRLAASKQGSRFQMFPINTELLNNIGQRLDLFERTLKELVDATPDEVAQRIREIGLEPEDLDLNPEN